MNREHFPQYNLHIGINSYQISTQSITAGLIDIPAYAAVVDETVVVVELVVYVVDESFVPEHDQLAHSSKRPLSRENYVIIYLFSLFKSMITMRKKLQIDRG